MVTTFSAWWLINILLLASCEGKRIGKLCGVEGYSLVRAHFREEAHWLCLTMKNLGSSSLTTYETALFTDPETFDDEENAIKAMSINHITLAYGFPVNDPDTGSAEGYIGADEHFYGVLHIGNRTLHADPHGTDDPGRVFHFQDDPPSGDPQRMRRWDNEEELPPGHFPYFPYRIEEHARVPGIARARICDLLLLADNEFYEKDANSNLDHAVQRMMHAVAQADVIFRNADFNEDGIPDNIGFSVKYILVLTSNVTSSRLFGELLESSTLDGRAYLTRFARLRRLSEVCLGVAFSGHAFFNRTLGLSFTSLGGGMGGAAGGLCDRRAFGRSFNTVALAHATTENSDRVPERVSALTLAHELGHSFGAHHDDNFPNPECKGYLMGAQSSTADQLTHFEFSICSKRLITATLDSMSYCLRDEDKPFCGNGIVENGEACDCGLPSRCSHKDQCCTPRAGGAFVYEEGTLHKEGCSVAPKASCHPSQGLCCNKNCHYADLSKHGIDCAMQHHECSCTTMSSACRCGLRGRCARDGSCHAAECALLGLSECHCTQAPIGTLQSSYMCGVCCLLTPKERWRSAECVAADSAAREVMRLANRSASIPELWPEEPYSGPNVSIQLCPSCPARALRAWPPGAPCVSRNAVGVCSPRGVCKPGFNTPRSNVFPSMLTMKLSEHSSSGFRVTMSILYCLLTVFVML